MKTIKTISLLFFTLLLSILLNSCENNDPEDNDHVQTFQFPTGSFKMIYCPGGTFLTNDDDDDLDFEDGPEVTVDPFWISETEVTNELLAWIFNSAQGQTIGGITSDYDFFNDEDNDAHNYVCESYVSWGSQDLMYMGGSQLYGYHDITYDLNFNVRSGLDEYPCTDITWYGAVMTCKWLTGKAYDMGPAYAVYSDPDEDWEDDETICHFDRTGFRLPTSMEWECAARWQGSNNSGECYEYPIGSGQYWTRGGCASGASALTTNVDATAAVAAYEYNSDGYTNPGDRLEIIGNRQPNALGLYDMSGNVWEWCFDENESGYSRIVRGGSVGSTYSDVRIKSSWYMTASGTGSDLGFRLVMSADQ